MYESILDSYTKHFITDFQVQRNPFKDSQVMLKLNGVHIRNPRCDAHSCWTSSLSPRTFVKYSQLSMSPASLPSLALCFICVSVSNTNTLCQEGSIRDGSQVQKIRVVSTGHKEGKQTQLYQWLPMGAASFRSPKARFYVNSGFKCWQIS